MFHQIIKSVNCENVMISNTGKSQNTKRCLVNIEYNVNNINYAGVLNIDNVVYSEGQTIKIEYLKSDPNLIRLPGLSDKTIGYISSTIAIIIILVSSINYYLSSNYKLYASAQGAQTIVGIFK